ncbi:MULTISPECIES: hypothetical protein [Sphingomonas]|uniref:Uncharacterized protein n=1 Tax=Sphingomonas leidyi TaxID=68569 RepID=A0A7X5ZVT7_9SPHN|nr:MULTISPECIES: hypothetical protein [Sphingomonas]MBN8813180.1 hypothetical protein [Sphingomonas sp.]NIJ64738.1 hypothetical protein [Sphingomonas leidyi]
MTTPPPFIIPANEWPDPQFCIQDANSMVTMLNDQMTGTMNQISVTSYTTGSRNVTAYTNFTDQLAVGDLIWFNAPADTALLQSSFRITALVPNTSFSFTTEYKDGAPSISAACMVNPLQRGAPASSPSGLVTSNIRRYAGGGQWPSVWISERPAHVGRLKSCRRVLVVQKTTGGDEYIYWEANGERLRTIAGTGRAVGLAVSVVSGTGASARAYAVDSATGVTLSGVTATTATRTWVSAQKTAAAAISTWQEGVQLSGPAGSTFVIGEFTSAPSAGELYDGSFSTPRGQRILALASISPWVGANLTTPAAPGPGGTYEFVTDMRQASYGVINEGVSFLTGLLEGQSDIAGHLLASRSRLTAPTVYNPIVRAPAAVTNTFGAADPEKYGFASGNFLVDSAARMIFYSHTPSNKWGFLSWDIHGAVLYAEP